MKVICIDDSNKPSDFPSPKWVKKDQEYTIEKIDKINMMGGVLGCTLIEIDTSNCFPYIYFNLDRFRPLVDQPVEELEEQLEMV